LEKADFKKKIAPEDEFYNYHFFEDAYIAPKNKIDHNFLIIGPKRMNQSFRCR